MPRSAKPSRKLPARPLWRGHLKLSLVSCPIALYNAITDSEDIKLNFLNPETGNRIKYQSIDAETGDLVERGDLIKGYEFEKDRYVTLTNEELDDLKIESSSIMDVEQFVPGDQISPFFFERGYYIGPDGDAGLDAYIVIRDAMRESGMFALARAVISRKERVIALKAQGDGIVGYGLREAGDIRADSGIFEGLDQKADRGALGIALKLIEQKTADFDPARFTDRYAAKLRELINAKLEGVTFTPEEVAPEPNVVNLMDALKRSLSASPGRAASGGARGGGTVHELNPRTNPRTRKAAPAGRKKPAKTKKAS